MLEPVLMGALADLVGLRWAFGLVAGVALLMAATAYRIIPAACRPVAVRLADVREP
jgi:predicted MFS family arabinose efflux permease